MKKKKQTPTEVPPLRTIKGDVKPDLITDGKVTFTALEEQNKEREQKRIDTETRIVNIAGFFLAGIVVTLAWIWFGWKMPVILILIIIANNLCNVKYKSKSKNERKNHENN